MHTKARFTRKTFALGVATVGMALLSVGCAISDYRGWLNHKTESEAKLWGSEIAFITGDPNLDGTYSYTVKYANGPTPYSGEVTIHTYRNPVVAAFSRDGCVDRDGDEIQGRAGDVSFSCDAPAPAGKFAALWRFGDNAVGCQFFANYEQTFGSPKSLPQAALCIETNEEVDKDLSLQAEAFTSLDDLFGRIWSGALGASFTANVTSVSFNGTSVNLDAPLALSLTQNGVRPTSISVDLSSPGGQSLLRAALANTADETPVRLAFGFDGGMGISQPVKMTAAFDHDGLVTLIR
jgi:hypothetical protein